MGCSTNLCAIAVVFACGQASAGGGVAAFTEEAVARGLDYTTAFGGSLVWGYGICFADLNGNGHPDLVTVGGVGGALGLWENDGTGHFTSRAATSGIPGSSAYSNVTAADIDGDGLLDLVFGMWDLPNRVYRNNGDFTFTNVSLTSGMADNGRCSSVAWGDINRDGSIDAYVANWQFSSTLNNILCVNIGDGTFLNVAQDLDVHYNQAMTYAVTIFDYNRDGWADIYVGNDRGPALGCGWPNRLWRNDSGTFTNVSGPSGADLCMDAMSATVGDFDRNGWPDLYVTNTAQAGGNKLLLNQGDGTFVESAVQTGTQSNARGWGSQLFDFDNDGHEDLFVCNEDAADRLYMNTGVWPAQDVAVEAGVADTGPSFTVAYADVNGDGAIDMLVSPQWGPIRLYINNEGVKRNWLRIVPLNAAGVAVSGAEAEVTAGGITRYAQLVHNSGYKSQNEHVLHFGLGDLTAAEEVTVTWPGLGTKTLADVAANQVLRLSFCLADLNGDGLLDLADISLFVGGFMSGDPIADLNGDGLFDLADLTLFVSSFVAGCP